MEPTFEPISAAEARPLRRGLLHPTVQPEGVDYPGDTHPAALHLGAFRDGTLIGIGTIHPQPMPGATPTGAWRVRDVALEHGHRGQGIAAHLVARLLEHAWQHEGGVAWAAVRVGAQGFFARCGFSVMFSNFADPNEGDQVLMHTPIRGALRSWGI